MRKKECVAMLLAGGQGSRLGVLTEKIAKPAVSFGGKYRMIDFSLSNCVNSGIDTVGVLIQYKPSLLNRYLGTGAAWDLDAAWGGDKTPEILSILEEKEVPATFFLVGRWVREFPDLTKAIAEAGHTIGSHSDSHPHFCSLSDDQIRKELTDTEKALAELGIPKPALFRPPFGEYDDRVVTVLRDAGYQVIQWSVDTLDWKE